VPTEDIVKGYKVDTDIEVKDELENIALESTRTIDIEALPCARNCSGWV
jgi:non-homologous end joining protein Ku